MKNFEFHLKQTDWNSQDYNDMINMMNYHEGIKDVFYGRQDRILTTTVSWMIQVNGQNIGFVNLVQEKADDDFLFLDMGIIEKYRGRGIGTEALKRVEQMLNENDFTYVIMETRKDNYGANQSAINVGNYLLDVNDRNVYLLQKTKYQEFIDNNMLEELIKHFKAPSKRKVLN